MPGSRSVVAHSEPPPPAWLAADAPQGDVALSSRCRVLRNLCGHRFPIAADDAESKAVLEKVRGAVAASGAHLESFQRTTPAERERFVAGRLASHGFEFDRPGRALLLDEDRSASVLVNEEDHLRVQGLTAGWSLPGATRIAERIVKRLSDHLEFAHSPRFGFLASSPHNAGEGRRLSVMFHLIGLAHTKRLTTMLKALGERGLTARGLFGESSRAIGAFVQVSAVKGSPASFVGACDYLLREERTARATVGKAALQDQAARALEYVAHTDAMDLADAYRILAWSRWAATEGLKGFRFEPRAVDAVIAAFELRPRTSEQRAAERRSEMLRTLLN